MGIKIEVETYTDKLERYPCIKISKNKQIVLFTSKQAGTLLDPGDSNNKIGYISYKWDTDSFELFQGRLIINCEI